MNIEKPFLMYQQTSKQTKTSIKYSHNSESFFSSCGQSTGKNQLIHKNCHRDSICEFKLKIQMETRDSMIIVKLRLYTIPHVQNRFSFFLMKYALSDFHFFFFLSWKNASQFFPCFGFLVCENIKKSSARTLCVTSNFRFIVP